MPNIPKPSVPPRRSRTSATASRARSTIGEHPLCLGPEAAARLGEDEAAAGASEQRDAELRLELAHLLRDGGLREVERARGGAEGAVLGRGEEVLELLDRHIGKTLL